MFSFDLAARDGDGRLSAARHVSDGRNGAPLASSGDTQTGNPAKLLQSGQDALTQGRLEEAERDFRQILQIDPEAGGAYANLGVVYMRRRQWTKALETLERAEHLLPQVAGI